MTNSFIKKIVGLLVSCLLLLLSSCDKQNYVYYIVDNQSNDSIAINYAYLTSATAVELETNSLIISSNKQDTLFTFEVISPSVYDKEDEDQLLYLMDVALERIRDNLETNKDVSLRNNWAFTKTTDNFANFVLLINEDDF